VSPVRTLSAGAGLAPRPTANSTLGGAAAVRPAYSRDAGSYDERTTAYQRFREALVASLPVLPGDAVLDVGCGTGLCFAPLLRKIGPEGVIVGVDESPEMLALARRRVARNAWRNVVLVESRVADADIPVTADAAVFCAVHDVLQSPAALREVVRNLRPGAWVAAAGGKWAAPWMVALNLQVRALHQPYVRSFEGFDRPWRHLGRLIEDLRVVDLALGAGYLAVGRVPARIPRPASAGSRRWSSSSRLRNRPMDCP